MDLIAQFIQAVFWIAIAIAALVILALLVTKNPHRGIGQEKFPDLIRNFMLARNDGASCTFRYAGKPAALVRCTRISGNDEQCDLLIDIPRTSLSESRSMELRDSFIWWGLTPTAPEDDAGVLFRFRCHVPNIWEPSSGATAAGITRKVFEVLGVGNDARFNFSMAGPTSMRIIKYARERG